MEICSNKDSMPVRDASELICERRLIDLIKHLTLFPSTIRDLELNGVSTLHRALSDRRCSVYLVKLLLDFGADPNFKNVYPTLLTTALDCKDRVRVGIIRALVEGGARADKPGNCSLLSRALSMNAGLEVVELLVGAGADILRGHLLGQGPLFHALKYFNVSAMKYFLKIPKVDVNTIRDMSEGTLLHSALRIEGCTVVFVKFLLDRGIRVDSVDTFKNTPLHVAVGSRNCDPDIVKVLVRRGSLVSVQNGDKESALDIAVRKRCDSHILKMLLKFCSLEIPGYQMSKTLAERLKNDEFWRIFCDKLRATKSSATSLKVERSLLKVKCE